MLAGKSIKFINNFEDNYILTQMTTLDKDTKIAFIGCGKMGEAALSGWLASDKGSARVLGPANFAVVEHTEAKRAHIAHAYGVDVLSDVCDLPYADIILLAVKPQVMPDILSSLSEVLTKHAAHLKGTPLVITIAAGISTSLYEATLGNAARVVRVMPNMPLQVGMGATVVAPGKSATSDDSALVNEMFSALGISYMVSEDQIDAVCAISGGGPAYVAYMVEALADAGEELGLDRAMAEQLALQTVGGTYHAMKANSTSPEDMRISVCSPGGTTLAALAQMDSDGFKPMFVRGMKAAVRRAEELRGLDA